MNQTIEHIQSNNETSKQSNNLRIKQSIKQANNETIKRSNNQSSEQTIQAISQTIKRSNNQTIKQVVLIRPVPFLTRRAPILVHVLLFVVTTTLGMTPLTMTTDIETASLSFPLPWLSLPMPLLPTFSHQLFLSFLFL